MRFGFYIVPILEKSDESFEEGFKRYDRREEEMKKSELAERGREIINSLNYCKTMQRALYVLEAANYKALEALNESLSALRSWWGWRV